jgi:NAD(P)H-flavin reductase
MLAGARRFGVAAAAGTSALGCAWLCAPSREQQQDGGNSLRALVPGRPLFSALQSKSWVSKDAVLLRFQLPSPDHTLGLPVPGHLMVVDAGNAYRPYSPVTIDSTASGYFDLLVRHNPRGEFSSQLARMEPGDEATFVGPIESRYAYRRSEHAELGLVAAGTGITPMWQVIQSALADPTDSTCISLVYASRSSDTILLKDELQRAAALHPTRFRATFLVSERDSAGAPPPPGVRVGRIDEEVLKQQLPPPPDVRGKEQPADACHLLVCGPDAMLTELCGPRARDGGVHAGPGATAQAKHPALGGLLRQLGYRANQVTWL